MNYAPVVLFVYNRPEHTKKTIDSLKLNECASKTNLIIYSDASKSAADEEMVRKTRHFIDQVTGFKSVTVRKRSENWGLAASIIDGVTSVVEEYGRIIVLEDDIITSPYFLSFMNQALKFYENKENVWHISGWNYPIDPSGLGDVFFWRVMNCWGWATWLNRWKKFNKDPEKLIRDWSRTDKKHFDLDNSGIFWSQVKANANGKINTWAIFWYATIFQHSGLCLHPAISYVNNIGRDGSGVHGGTDSSHSIQALNDTSKVKFPADIKESKAAVGRIKLFYKRCKDPFFYRVIKKFGRIFLAK